jgi:glycosyltransferase involved in cell wall biosynthesis
MSSVDVVIPCYNYARYLRECAHSALRQDGVDVRVLIIDDCSPDNTPEVAAALVAENPGRVEYRRHAVNQRHIATYNEGLLGWASAEYSILLSADDMLTPGALRRAAVLMDAHPNVAMCHGRGIKTPTPSFDSLPDTTSYASKVVTGLQFIEESCAEGDNIVSTPTVVVRTKVQQAIGGYLKELPHTGDMEMWLRFAAHGDVGYVDAPQAFYRTHAQQMNVSYLGPRDVYAKRAAFDTLFGQYGNKIQDAQRLSRLAARSLAEYCFWTASRLFDAGELQRSSELLKVAPEMDPSIRRGMAWQRFRAKRLLGPSVWGTLKPLVRRLRGSAVAAML